MVYLVGSPTNTPSYRQKIYNDSEVLFVGKRSSSRYGMNLVVRVQRQQNCHSRPEHHRMKISDFSQHTSCRRLYPSQQLFQKHLKMNPLFSQHTSCCRLYPSQQLFQKHLKMNPLFRQRTSCCIIMLTLNLIRQFCSRRL